MNNYLVRVFYDNDLPCNYDDVEVSADSFMSALNKALLKLSPIQKQYMHSMQVYVACDAWMPE